MEEITAMWPPVSYISSLWCILLGSCCFNLWEFPHGCFHMVAWLTMRADRIIGLVAANKLLLLSDPMRVFHDAFPWLLVCLCVYLPTCVSQCVCMCVHDPGLLVSEKEMKSIVFSPSPTVSHFFLLLHLHFLARPTDAQNLSYWQKSWVAVTSQQTTKTTAIKCNWDIHIYLLKEKVDVNEAGKKRRKEREHRGISSGVA